MREEPTHALVTAAGQRDGAALDELVARYLPRLHAYVRLQMGAQLRAREGSMDVVQSVCREVIGDIRQGFEFRGEAAFLSWLFQAALNKIRDRHRHQGAAMRDPAREEPFGAHITAAWSRLLSPTQAAVDREGIERIEGAFDRLPAEYQQVITLARLLELPHAEIAVVMDRSPGATRMLLGRALARLGELLGGESPDRGDHQRAKRT